MNASTLLYPLFKYKEWANKDIFMTMKLFDERRQATERHTAIRILNHTYVVDRIFAANVQGLTHEYTATNTAETPTLEQLDAAVRESDRWYVDYVSKLDARALSEDVDFTFTDGAPGRMSREEMLMHVALHGGYHRGAVGRIMAEVSLTPPRDLFTGYLHQAEPEKRRR